MSALGEEQINLAMQKDLFVQDNKVANVYYSFVVEKDAILVYAQELVNFAAQTQGIDVSAITPGFDASKSKIKKLNDAMLAVNRITAIVSQP